MNLLLLEGNKLPPQIHYSNLHNQIYLRIVMEGTVRRFTVITVLFLQIIFSSPSAASSLCQPSQSFALLQFKNNLAINISASYQDCDQDSGVTSFPKTVSWREDTDCCLWDGVVCDESTGNVIRVDVSCSWLYGKIPSNSTLFQLSHLQRLNLAHNDFHGSSFSPELGRLVNLTHLNISFAGLSGIIPSQISYLSKMVSLDIKYNFDYIENKFLIFDSPTFEMLSGNLTHLKHLFLDYVNMSAVNPKSFLNLSVSLESLGLSNCLLQGEFPINVFNLVYLKQLIVSYNSELIVTLPKSNWSGPLESLDASFTSFSGELPYSVANLKSLKSLSLDNCGLRGSIPSFIWNLTQISRLSLGSNNLTGKIPTFLSNLRQLTYLSLSSNNLNGQVPDLFGNLTKLTVLDLQSNNLEGHLPSSIFSHPELLRLSLSDNELVSLPSDVRGLSKLTDLNLKANKLNGTIPSWLFNLSSLTSLDLTNNLLAGQIPEFKSKSLVSLWLQQNMLYGPIPETITGLVNLSLLNLLSNKINGTIPPRLFSMSSLQQLDLGNNQLTGGIPEFQSKSFQAIYLDRNMLHGQIPESVFQLSNLSSLSLSSNSFFGIIELDRFQKLKNLRQLDLSYTNISIPTSNTSDMAWPKLMSLALSSCNLSEFPNFLRTQDELQRLDLSSNNIRGDIPKWMLNVGKETLWVLNLSNNHLTGTVQLPWQKLQIVDLNSNMLHGLVPVFPPGVSFFSVSNNSLSGNVSSWICDVSSLEILDLSHNNLSGKILPCLGNFSTSLSVLDLQMNNFEGTIRTTFSEECKLRNLNFQGNKLEGPLPNSLVNCKELEVLDLGNNILNDTFPSWLGILQELQVLVLRSNKLHGSIPELRTNNSFPKLLVLDLSNNKFSGRLPAKTIEILRAMVNAVGGENGSIYLGTTKNSFLHRYDYSMTVNFKGLEKEIQKIFHVFTSLDLSSNNFQGQIPDDLGKLHSLRGLNLSHNSLSGQIPPSLGDLTSLEWLDLSSNKLVGEIPNTLPQLTSLAIFNVSENELVGKIPQRNQFNTFGSDSYQGNLGLCGFPLPAKCQDEEPPPPPPPPTTTDDSGSFFEKGFSWQPVVIGYGSGLTFGVIMGSVMFQTRRPRWLWRMIAGIIYGIIYRKQGRRRRRRN